MDEPRIIPNKNRRAQIAPTRRKLFDTKARKVGNNGGAMVASVLRAAAHALPLRIVHASVGKVARAEPVAALFESKRAWFAGDFPDLEDELAGLVQGGGYQGPSRSPDRADACVWALTELMLGKTKKPRVRGL